MKFFISTTIIAVGIIQSYKSGFRQNSIRKTCHTQRQTPSCVKKSSTATDDQLCKIDYEKN